MSSVFDRRRVLRRLTAIGAARFRHAPSRRFAPAAHPAIGVPGTTHVRTRQFFTMRNKSLRYKNSWCTAQIRCFAMPKNVPQYKTREINHCFYGRIFVSRKRSTRAIGRGPGRRLCSMH
ncbi:hypothetical protein [Burkholderia sp. RF2-non_BP3]|uniref:hypothetical protein n=1 Tax=Burkholderia sp. RF2-non_BP3 TaxID=1637844 RepID=UPI0012E3454B|nr:hypothetical protein [Burkholderia sp. RF2-non_BP3]